MQMADKILGGSGADSKQSSGGFQCRWLMRFRTVWCRQGSGRFRMTDEGGRIPVQIASKKVCGKFCGIMAENRQASGFWCRWLMRFRKVPVQMDNEVPDGSGADSRQSC